MFIKADHIEIKTDTISYVYVIAVTPQNILYKFLKNNNSKELNKILTIIILCFLKKTGI